MQTPENTATKPMRFWLFTVAFMIWAMCVIGAVTRLTESGLSITEWKPISGAIPPLTETEWQDVFAKYKAIPEFQHVHSWMELADFKKIFFWEWLHRLWGRLIGLAFALPLAFFWLKKQVPQHLKKPLLGILALGALQGAVGWWMVKSGLSTRIDVSHFRLATHLSLALVIYSCILWVAYGLLPKLQPAPACTRNLKRKGWHAIMALAFVIVWGAFTAGLDAGKIYNTWPLMGGQFFPPEPFSGLSALLNTPAFVQFTHRWLGFLAGVSLLVFARLMRSKTLAVLTVAQVGLGITTVVTGVHLHVAATHQANGILLLGYTLYLVKRCMLKPKEA